MTSIRTTTGWIHESMRHVELPGGDANLPIRTLLSKGVYWSVEENAIVLFYIETWTSISLSLPLLEFCSVFYDAATNTTGGSCSCNGIFDQINVYGGYLSSRGTVEFTMRTETCDYKMRGELIKTFLMLVKGGSISFA